MKTEFTTLHFHAGALPKPVVLLTLILLMLPENLHAEDKTAMTPMPLFNARPSTSTWSNDDRNQQLAQLLDYVRKRGPALVPGLPDALRGPTNYMMGQLRSTEDRLGFDSGNEDGGGNGSLLSPVFSLITSPDESDTEALWLSPGYHHAHGMLPFDDAVTVGFNYRNALTDTGVKLDIHPFYAQSWDSADGYWGVETALGFVSDNGRQWGKIAVRFDKGSSSLMDQQHGLDMHADFSFDDHLTLTAGAQQNEDSDLGNYVLLKWKMEFGQ